MNTPIQLSTYEKDALRLYGGDTRVRNKESEKITIKRSDDIIWGDKTAYKTLNALMFEGTENEEIRIIDEGSKLNPHFIENIDSTIEILSNIYCAMCKYSTIQSCDITAYRIERNSSIKHLMGGNTISCFSASKVGFQEEFTDKAEIVLIELTVKAGAIFIDYEDALGGEYYLFEEKEVLIPPFVPIHIEKIELLTNELELKDKYGKPPKGKYKVVVSPKEKQDFLSEEEKREKVELYEIITNPKVLNEAQKYITNMNAKNKVEEETRVQYCTWKNNYQKYMRYVFRDIESRI